MTIETKIQVTAPILLSKKTVLNILYAQHLILEKFNELLKPYEISTEQFNVLRILRGQNGKAANMCLIQERMIAKTSNTTRLVDKLLLKELVTRTVCPDNRRKMEVLITAKGLNLLSELDPKVIAFESSFSDNLSEEELEKLNYLLEKYSTSDSKKQ
jgi:DNA-binding MarR family transcriptional regulator